MSMISAQERDYAGRDRLLLTVTFPIKENLTASFRAAMLSFPQGSVQQVLTQLQDREMLWLILDGLTNSPDRLGEASGKMEGRGCPGVEIEPVETVGYYHLETEAPRS